MSCGGCNCDPCACDDCDAEHESLASALDNFQTSFFGTLTKTCVDGKVVWGLPCDLEAGFPGFPRNEGEGIACYLLRIYGALIFLHYFPGYNSVFVDEDYVKMSANGQPAFPTFQQAYTHADALQISTVKPVIIVVGNITAAISGGVVLLDDWNDQVNLVGLGSNISFLGTIQGSTFDVDFAASNINLEGISTSINNAASAADAGSVTISVSASVFVGAIDTTTSGTGNGGAVTIVGFASHIASITTSSTSGSGGAITCDDFSILGPLIADGGVLGGDVTLGIHNEVESIKSRGIGATASGGAIHVGAYGNITSTTSPNTDSSGGLNGGTVTLEKYCTCVGILSSGTLGTGGAVSLFDYCDIRSTITASGGTTPGQLDIRRYNVVIGTTTAIGGTGGASVEILDHSAIAGLTLSATAGNSGVLEIRESCKTGNITHTALAGNSGTIEIDEHCVVGNIDNRALTTAGAIVIEDGTVAGTINNSASTTGGTVSLMNGTSCNTITMGATGTGILKALSTRIVGSIDNLSASSVLHNCTQSTSVAQGSCIKEITGNSPRITNCLFIPGGAADSIEASVARTVIAYNNLFKNAVDANVTLLGANNNVDALLLAP